MNAIDRCWRTFSAQTLRRAFVVVVALTQLGCVALPESVAIELEPASADKPNHFRKASAP